MRSAQMEAPATLGSPAGRRRLDRLFFGGFAAVAIALVFAAFARSYYLGTFTGAPRLSLVVHLHAAAFSAWMVLFATQVSLVATRRIDLHRRLGKLGVAFACLIVVAGLATSIVGARNGWTGPGNPRDAAGALGFVTVPFGDLVLFVGFFGAAIWFRRVPDTHKRLMVLAMIGGILPPAFGRLPGIVTLIAAIGLLAAGPIYDRLTRGRIHRVYLWGVPLIVASVPLRIWLAGTDAWRGFARWMIGAG